MSKSPLVKCVKHTFTQNITIPGNSKIANSLRRQEVTVTRVLEHTNLKCRAETQVLLTTVLMVGLCLHHLYSWELVMV